MELECEQYMNYLKKDRRLSDNSLASYKRDLSFLQKYMKGLELASWSDVQKYHISKYVHALKEEGRKPATIARKIVTLRAFFQYLTTSQIIPKNPADQIESPKSEKRSPAIMSQKQIGALLDAPGILNAGGKRDKAMLELLYATGIRVTELISLNIEHVHVELGYIQCTSSFYKERIVPIGQAAKQALASYLEEGREELVTSRTDSSALFLNHLGTRLTRQGFWKILKKHAGEAGIDEEITPQMLRHSVAAHLLENGADIRTVQEMLGHVEIATTLKYIQSASPRLMDAYQQAHPRA